MLIARRYRVRGRVQGVGFRFFTERAALREGLHGWVRNAADGSVEVEVEGDAEAMARFEALISVGPIGARVEDVETTEVAPHGRATGFMTRG
ncbi:MAG: acylphosphatase [Vicinamibacterales bacterium]|nr:acylphosphatase [Vicinamibacterales bacterium]